MTFGALASSLLVCACATPARPTPTPTPHPTVRAVGPVIAPPSALALARTFAAQFVAGQYAAQWAELAPETQAIWPSEAARTNMLRAKFSGQVTGMSLGSVSPESLWTEPERPSVQFANVWSVPVQVAFAATQRLRPDGVARLFSMTALQIAVLPTGPEVVGEGPASMDAPIILPQTVTNEHVDVPILMYHLVDQVPPRSIEPSTYGWELEIGLTTLPVEFAAQMTYLASIHATSISLQHLADALLYGLPLPPHSVVITFDDGRLSPWYNAVPVLRRDGFTAVFFPCSGLIGKKVGPQTYLSASEIQDLATTGFSIEDHTFNDAQALFGASTSTLNRLTDQTKTSLDELTGAPVQFLAYTGIWPWPLATEGGGHEAPMFATLASYGYVGGVLDVRVNSELETTSGLWQLPRLRIGIGTTVEGFARWFTA
jgi:peptidoglycan/xylan/chitin deacetylase (PgdA/CDA1 family)